MKQIFFAFFFAFSTSAQTYIASTAAIKSQIDPATIRSGQFLVVQTNGLSLNYRPVLGRVTSESPIEFNSTKNVSYKWVHDWNGDVRAFGAFPYQPKYTLVPWGYKTTAAGVGSGNFSIYLRVDFPSSYTQPVGMFEISPIQSTNYTTATFSSIGMRASPQNWGFVFRSTTGASGAGSTTNDAAVLDSLPATISAYAGQTVDVVLTRSGTNAVVYFNGVDVTSLFTLSNPLGWSKSLALGNDLLLQVGNSVNPWYWPKPIRKFAFWNIALNSSQAANPSAVGSKLVDYTAEDVTEPPDLTDALTAAVNYTESKGGGKLIFPPGVFRVSGTIPIKQRTWWQGSGSAPYPSVFNQAHRPGSTVLWSYVGGTNAIFKGDLTQGTEVCLSLRSSILGNIHTTWLRSKISDMVLVGSMSESAEGIFLDRVAAVEIKDVSFYGIPGHPIRVYGGNNIKITGCDSGNMGRGLDIRGCADVMVQENFFDSPRGPALRWVCNLSKAVNNTFEVSQDPRASTPAYENPTSVNPATDEFYATNYYGHLLTTGQAIRFDEDFGTLPTPITNNVDYYVIKTGKNTFKVSTTYADEITQTGAFYGNGVLDITSTGSTTTNWYSGVAQSFNFLVSGDHNEFIGNHGQQGYDGGMRLEGGPAGNQGGNNSIIGNSFILSGFTNPRSNDVAGLVLIDSDYNSIIGNQLDDRDNTSYSQNGIIMDTNSLYNTAIGNSWNVNVPYTIAVPYRNTILDAQYVLLSGGTVYLADGQSASTNIYKAFRVNTNPSGPQWNADNGTLSVTNIGTAQRLVNIDSPYYGGLIRVQVNSATGSQRPEIYMMRNYTNVAGSYQPPATYSDLGGIFFGGYRSNNVGSETISAGLLSYSDGTQWDLGNANSQINLLLTPPNSTTMIAGLLLQHGSVTNQDLSPLVVSATDGSTWSSAASGSGIRFQYGANDSAGAGYRTVRVRNK